MSPKKASPLTFQIQGLSHALECGDGLLTTEQNEQAQVLLAQAQQRFHLSPEHTTVGFFGATGSGKSSLFNRVIGKQVATAGVTRPTTFKTTAAVSNETGTEDLLRWLQVDEVHVAGGEPSLILLDLPDFDSVAEENRGVVDRLVGQVDVLVWVVDPQKYGDRVIHQDYIRPLSHHASTTLVVLNQVDLLDEGEREQITASLQNLLVADGLEDATVLPSSALTGEGVDQVRSRILEIARRRYAAAVRMSADITKWASSVLEDAGTSTDIDPVAEPTLKEVKELREAVYKATSVSLVGDAVAASYRKRSNQVTGWPVVSWMSRFRTDPLRRLGIEKAAETGARTSLPPLSAASRAGLNTAVRRFASQVGAGVPSGWRHSLDDSVDRVTEGLQDHLDRAVSAAEYNLKKPWWWSLAAFIQWVMLTAAVVGAGWYLVSWATTAFGLPVVPISKVEGWPVPGLLVVLGLLSGLILAALFSVVAAAGGARRRRRALKSLKAQLDSVIRQEVVEPLTAVTNRMKELRGALLQAEHH